MGVSADFGLKKLELKYWWNLHALLFIHYWKIMKHINFKKLHQFFKSNFLSQKCFCETTVKTKVSLTYDVTRMVLTKSYVMPVA